MSKKNYKKLNKVEQRVLKLCSTKDKIVPGDIASEYSQEFKWINLKKTKKVLASLKEKGFLKGMARTGYRNNKRFTAKCKSCGKSFKTSIRDSTLCYTCSRDRATPIEQRIHPQMKGREQLDEFRWGNLHEGD